MNTEKHNVTVKIMDREFNVKCPHDKVGDLHKAAKYLDSKMRELRHDDKILNVDGLWAITAINITHELLSQKRQNVTHVDTMNQQIKNLQKKIEQALDDEQ